MLEHAAARATAWLRGKARALRSAPADRAPMGGPPLVRGEVEFILGYGARALPPPVGMAPH